MCGEGIRYDGKSKAAFNQGDTMAGRIRRALNDPLIRERVNKLAPVVAARNGVTAAAEHLEALARPGQ